jgi:hypothetical protein
VILTRTVTVIDPFARANLVAALAGPGAPAGVTSCAQDGALIVVAFEAERTSPELIDALIEIETTFVPGRAPALGDLAAAVRAAARGLDEPALDAARIIETYLP